MSLADTPVKKYVPWRPNMAFVKFFQNMKKRRIADGDPSSLRVTDTPPSQSSDPVNKQKSKKHHLPSGSPPARVYKQDKEPSDYTKNKNLKRGSVKKKKKKSGKKIVLEKKIRDYTF